MSVTIKPLEWNENFHPRQRVCKEWYAETAWHDYWIEQKRMYWVRGLHRQWQETFKTLEEAKAACQKDLYYRIMEHIDV